LLEESSGSGVGSGEGPGFSIVKLMDCLLRMLVAVRITV
jgi:hypothetical protein